MTAHKIGTLNAPARAAWELLTDWAGLLRWLPEGVSNVVRVELEGGLKEVPRTRVLWNSDGTCVRETLLHQDDGARRIYYMVQREGIPGVRNYLATTTIDELGAEECQIELSSSFDVIDPAVDEQYHRRILESIYEDCILKGLATYLRSGQKQV